MSLLVALPVGVPAASAAAALLAWRSPRAQRAIAVVGGFTQLLVAAFLLSAVWEAGHLSLPMGSWPAPYGITLVADLFSAIMVLLAALTGLAVLVYALADVDGEVTRRGLFPLLHVLLTGVSGAFVSGDLFNLYVFFEVMLIASFVLLVIGGERGQLRAGLHYVLLNLLSSSLFLMAAGLVYGIARTLNFADLSRVLPVLAADHPAVVAAAGAALLLSFAIKAGLFPLYFWLPASYHTLPASVAGLFAGLLTKVGVYALVRACTLVLPVSRETFEILAVLAGLTMVIGVLGAVSQFEIRRILGFHIISQIGYMVLGLGLLLATDPQTRRLALTATVFYVTHHILVKTNLYLLGGAVAHLRGSTDLSRLGGLARSAPWLAALFLVPALSLAGIPPLSGFWAKLAIIQAGLRAGAYVLIAAAIAAGLLTLLSMMKIWNEAFWKPRPEGVELPPPLSRLRRLQLIAPCVVLALGTLALGLAPEPFFALAARAADQLLEPALYAEAVLGGAP